ncbi:hypothetical protein ASPWEDRAFT_178829 [Aspergillus wentii DTO 134E9]|uniref:Zn(2)-C6 fungal-type domain-containing protein n=1 Tax=Aspergillus wentii DTO 134E9 TaxID=1073089 RepID=A0A1L9S1L6_ASPWE|nr:uncharacterized protein ASPWEDRAFT_178829 [Aspergillus wentii DTO 134E9]KAI9930957.1 hypothetical protein MW887_010612 [Aspergillus wentii]OJJ41051.1 hypothetical protein ASPWEDRAFT_178829 [Aspergillus wentii DTO 134E9]
MTTSLQHLLQNVVEPESPTPEANSTVPGVSAPASTSRKRPAPRGTAAYPRRRAVKACETCRSRRTRCDNKKPSCSFCEKVGAKCVTGPTDFSSFDPASLVIIERLDRIEQFLRSEPSDESTAKESTRKEQDSPANIDSPVSNPPNGPDFSTFTIETVLSWPVFQNRFDSRLDLKALLNHEVLDAPSAIVNSPIENFLAKDLEPGAYTRLLNTFLKHVHPANPILDVSLLCQYVQQACINGIQWDAPSCLVLLVCALGSIAEAFHSQHQSNSMFSRNSSSFIMARSYFEASQKRIGLLLSRNGILEAQCFFYSGVYLMTLQQPMAAWRFFVQAAAISQGFDFPRKYQQSENKGLTGARHDRVSQESVYWTCLKSELEVRMELSLPGFGLQDLSYPTSFPSPPLENLEEDAARAWYYYLAEIALRRLANRVLYNLFQNQEEGRFPRISLMVDSVIAFEKQAADWMTSLPPMFSLATPEAEDDVLKFVLRGHLLDCYEWMYFPFMLEAINYNRRDPLLDEYTTKGLAMSVERIHKNKPGFYHRHHGAWLMLRSCTRSALILLAASHSEYVQDLVPEGWKEAVFSTMDMLRFWEDEVGDARDRLQILTELMSDLGYRM